MEYMYGFALLAHFYSVLGMLIVILINLYFTKKISSLSKLRRFMVIFTPIGSIMIGSVIFTGIVMMAAKHLHFTWQNNLMIVAALVFIYLEVKRTKTLKYLKKEFFVRYKNFATVLLFIESAIVIVIATIMRL
jgi:hypothetical protein